MSAHLAWGFLPLFWKLLDHVGAFEILAHRLVWAAIAFSALVWIRGRVGEVLSALSQWHLTRAAITSGILLSINWVTFLYAVATDRVLHASLGYFINPLFVTVLGFLFLAERPSRTQWIALAIATVGVLVYSGQIGSIPWISLLVAMSFALYALARKTMQLDALLGSSLELLLIAPAAIAGLAWMASRGEGRLGHASIAEHALLAASGLVTAIPNLWYANATRRLPLHTMGFLQFLTPSTMFLLSVFALSELVTPWQLLSFVFIWAGLLMFALELVHKQRQVVA